MAFGFMESLMAGVGQKMIGNIGSGKGMFGKEGGFMSKFGTGEGQMSQWKPLENIKAGKGFFGKEGGFGSGKGVLSETDWQGLAGRMAGTYLQAVGVDTKGSFEGSESKFFAGMEKGLDFSKKDVGDKLVDTGDPEGAFDVPPPYASPNLSLSEPYLRDTGEMFRSQYSGGRFRGSSNVADSNISYKNNLEGFE